MEITAGNKYIKLGAHQRDYSHHFEKSVMKLTTLVGTQEQRFLVSLFHSRAMWQSNESQKVLIFITLPHKFKEMPMTFLDFLLCFHSFTFTTIPCTKGTIETLEQGMQLS